MRTKHLIKRTMPYYKRYWKSMVFDLFCAGLTTICELILPLIIKYFTNTAIEDISQLTIKAILMLGGTYIVLRVIDAAANYYMASYGHIMGTKIETDMRRDMFNHLQKLSFTYYDSAKVGQIMSRITTDLFDVTEFSHHCPEEFFIAGIKIVASFIILLNVNVWLTLIMFAVLPLMFAVTSSVRKKMKKAFQEQRAQCGDLNAKVEDSLLGIRVVKSFANEEVEKEKFAEGNELFFKVKTKAYKYMGAFSTTTRVFDGIMYIVVVMIGAIFMLKGYILPGDYVAYLLYVSTLLASVRRIIEFMEQFQRGMTGIERFAEIMDIEPDITDSPNAQDLENVKGNIEFKNVTFGYGEDSVLENVSIKVEKGMNIALVGPSGGGKTTMCSLIPRFYELNSGEILIDGKNIKEITLKSLRENIGIVQQDVYLFSGSVLENIAYGKPGATFEEIKAAAKMAGAEEFIEKLPQGYDTYVGERGVKLSGGQKQRISIARVFLKNPPILILDEATSALDNESEKIVQESLERLSKGRTTFTIAHRLTTIQNATEILVLTADGIAERGTHEELLSKKGIYYNLNKR
ncbi:MAG: ABC transporter ATP-binding protein [Ruminococcaceae bacterium]|nr:ABC transporter ATP-binding protein [Oscillospiraceae bacterium]